MSGLQPSGSISLSAANDLETFFMQNLAAYDFDGSGGASLTDAVLYSRYALGFRGARLLDGLTIPASTTVQQIEATIGACF